MHDDQRLAANGPGRRVMGTLERPTAGVVRIAGEDTSAMSDSQLSGLRARRLGFVFQQFFLLESHGRLRRGSVPPSELGTAADKFS